MLLTARNLGKSYGHRLLFSGITLGLAEAERVGLIGANGSGKSTLLRIFAGLEQPDEGELEARRLLRVGYVPQADTFDPAQSCIDAVADAIDPHHDAHERELEATVMLDRAGFADPHARVGTLSGGWSKRLAIVRQLARDPELLLIDEPTNHLDIDGIEWLEDLIAGASFATLIVSHDRRFLENVANRIIELGRQYPDGFLSHNGSYSDFLAKREDFLAAQAGREQALASGVRREIAWLRRGAKARTTKAKGRIDRAGEMMADLADLRQRNARQSAARIDFTASDRKTRKLVELKHVSKQLGGRMLFEGLSLTLAPGTKLGLLGPNGSGKSTLIRLITHELAPDSGQVVHADGLRIVVFDQHREQLNPAQTLRRSLAATGDNVTFQGQSLHVSGYARQFLFRPDQLELPVGELSGGEQARVLIARLMLREADVLVLDEPTNDLDIPTLDVLEASLEAFPGALVLVTHDRYLLDRVATDILALDGRGAATAYADLDQWERARDAAREQQREAARQAAVIQPARDNSPARAEARKRLSWKEQKELEQMEAAILTAEQQVARLEAQTGDPQVLADHARSRQAFADLASAQAEVERLYHRWSELDARR